MVQVAEAVSASGAAGLRPRLLFGSYHCYLDPSSGAAIATRDLLELLGSREWNARAFCGANVDFEQGESLPQLLSDQGVSFQEGVLPGRSVAFLGPAI